MPTAIYFEGDSKRDPGYYLDGNGPYFSYRDAMLDAGSSEPTDLIQIERRAAPRLATQDAESGKILVPVKFKNILQNYLLAVSLGLLCLTFWYGVYRLTIAVIL